MSSMYVDKLIFFGGGGGVGGGGFSREEVLELKVIAT